MFEVLRGMRRAGALLPEVDALFGVPQPPSTIPEIDTGVHMMMVLDMAARHGASLCRCATPASCTTSARARRRPTMLPRHIGHEERSVELMRARERAPARPTTTAASSPLSRARAQQRPRSGELGAAALVRLLERCDAFRRPERFCEMLPACECDATGRLGLEDAALSAARRACPRR